MIGLKMIFENGAASVDWNATETGVHQLKSKVINHFMTRRGTDKIDPTRGTDLDTTLMSVGAFDAVGIQHELNFAVIEVVQHVRASNDDAHPEASITGFRAVFSGYNNGRAAVALQVTNAAGDVVGTITEL